MDLLLAKQKPAPGWIDLSIGEAHIIKDNLFEVLDRHTFLTDLNKDYKSEYPPPHGYEPLVNLLEEKYNAPIIITNGAKQALGASFYILNKIDKTKLGMRTPYWALIPPLAKAHGLTIEEKYNSYLMVSPNNPDAFMFEYDYLKWLSDYHKDLDIPFIHDAVYYYPTYVSNDYKFGKIGDIQIYSLSKMLGLSGLRIGFIVCHNTEYYKLIQEYIETMTAGVSTVSQSIATNILGELFSNSEKEKEFISKCRNDLFINKSIVRGINPSILDIPENITDIPGMFLWAKVKRNIFERVKIKVSEGKHFGQDGYIRMNLAVPSSQMIEVVKRLNSFV